MAQKYLHIFFDLDRTLWDFDRNSRESLTELINLHNLEKIIESPEEFVRTYHRVNIELWRHYRCGKMTKEVLRSLRFRMTLGEFGIRDDDLAHRIGKEYLRISPRKTLLVPHAIEMLEYLMPRSRLHIITNGFRESQEIKIRNCRLEKYFTSITTSETIGYNKPRPEIFQHALSTAHAKKSESLMVGDDLEVDIAGARNFGIDQAFLNIDGIRHNDPVTHEISSLLELKQIL